MNVINNGTDEYMHPTENYIGLKLYTRNEVKEYQYLEGNLLLSHWTLMFYTNPKDLKDTKSFEATYNSLLNMEKRRDVKGFFIELEFKDFQYWIICVPDEDKWNILPIKIGKYACLKEKNNKSLETNCMAFQFKLRLENFQDGWNIYKHEKDFERLFSKLDPSLLKWKLCDKNINYEICKSYPRIFAIPKSFDVKLLKSAAEYRDESRFPALSWIHPVNYATITRCSQPLPGRLGNKRCDGEKLIKAIFATNHKKSISENRILDARPYTNAVANRARGAGFENTDFYGGCQIEFLNIENMHQVRESVEKLRKLVRTSTSNDTNWLSKLEATGWLQHIYSLLKGAVRLADLVRGGHSVVVHCSHGWDRTAQLSGLAQIILDPHYRTLIGFQELIEKEWISFGHKNLDRAGHISTLDPSSNLSDRAEESPIFLQFVDCVYQLLVQFPTSFGFSEKFLCVLLEHYYSCRFGTFLANTERDQYELKLRERTLSLWSFTNHELNIKDFVNPLFVPNNKKTFLPASYSPDRLVFWNYFYNGTERIIHKSPLDVIIGRYKQLLHSKEKNDKEVLSLKAENKKLLKLVEEMEEKIKKLEENGS